MDKFSSDDFSIQQFGDSQLFVPPLLVDAKDAYYYHDHFQSIRGYFVLIADTDCQSYVAPRLESDTYQPLNEGTRVRVLFEKSQFSDVEGSERRWVFVSNESGDTFLGWIFKDQLAYESSFKVLPNTDFKQIDYEKGEFKASIKSLSNARFILDWKAEGNGLYLDGVEQGRFYSYKQIIWAKKSYQDFIYEFFIFDEEDNLLHEFKYINAPISFSYTH